MARVLVAAAMLTVMGCSKPAPPPPAPAPPVVASPAPPPAPKVLTAAEADALLAMDCQACHSLAYVKLQRLTEAQWKGTLAKMRTFGSLLDEASVEPLAAYLGKAFPADGPLVDGEAVDAETVLSATHARPDGARPAGEAKRGGDLFGARCLACHGADARGGIGVNLVEKPVLFQADTFVATVKAGRGRMPPHADLDDAKLADVLAHLRSLRL